MRGAVVVGEAAGFAGAGGETTGTAVMGERPPVLAGGRAAAFDAVSRMAVPELGFDWSQEGCNPQHPEKERKEGNECVCVCLWGGGREGKPSFRTLIPRTHCHCCNRWALHTVYRIVKK